MILVTKFEQYLKNLRGALHVGANIGEERSWYAEQGFTKVLWFEPNIDLFPILLENILPYENQVAFNIGIHDTLRKAILHISNNKGQSSSLLDLEKHKIYHPKVKFIKDQVIVLNRLDSFLENEGFDISTFNFLNIDVQGVELNVLKSLGNQLGKLDYVYLEVNDQKLYKGCSLLPEIDVYLSKFNFIRLKTKMTKYHWGDAFYIKEGSL